MSTIASPGMRARARRLFVRVHGPTWLVAAAVYGGWLALTLAHDRVPLPLLMVLGGIVIAWHGSLQHETIHGHPAGPPWLAGALGAAPLSLWLPYGVYRDTHRRHHATEHLTDPEHDPESPFRHAHQPYLLGSFGRALAFSQRTTLGRLVLGPLLCIGRFVASEARLVWGGAPGRRRAWLLHALAVSVVLAWLMGVVAMPLWKYVVSFVYPGASLTLLRSLAEHRSDVVRARRTTVVEAGLFFRLLFLNNNLHVVHHRFPHVPWFELPARWQGARAELLASHPDLVHPGYLALLGAHAVRPLATPEVS